MNLSIIIDIVLVAIIWIVASVGYKKGLIKTVYGLIAFVLAAALTALYHETVAEYLMQFDFMQDMMANINQSVVSKITPTEMTAMPVWMNETVNEAVVTASMGIAEKITQAIITVITVVVTFILVKILLGFTVGILDAIMKLPILNFVNSAGGMLFGVIKGVLIVLILCAALTMFMPMESYESIHNAMESTYIAKYFYNNNILMTLIMR